MPHYKPEEAKQKIDLKGKKVIIVTDSVDINENIGKMILHAAATLKEKPEIVNLSEIKIKGGCLGCLNCGFDNECVYDGKDDIRKVYEEKIAKADILIYAGSIIDRFLSSKWKVFIDRSFFNTHQPNLVGKQIGFLISGPLSEAGDLSEFIRTYVDLNDANLVNMVSDEYESSEQLDTQIEHMVNRLVSRSLDGCTKCNTFRGIAGVKLFRDELWGRLHFVFQEDHRYYKKHRLNDFPQKNIRMRITNLFMIAITKIPPIKKNIQKETIKYMIIPHRK
jgi:multimeric flavodoxin WrbA